MKEVIAIAKWETGEDVRFFDITRLPQAECDRIEHHVEGQINNQQYYTYQKRVDAQQFDLFYQAGLVVEI